MVGASAGIGGQDSGNVAGFARGISMGIGTVELPRELLRGRLPIVPRVKAASMLTSQEA